MSKAKLLKNSTIVVIMVIISTFVNAQEQEEKSSGLEITGSGDIYYTYDFSGQDNISTSFADSRNNISIGMIDLGLSHSFGKVSFFGELAFGPRSFKSIPLFDVGDGDDVIIGIQNLYLSYAITDKLSMTAGYMGTFVGYEVISPVGNFNYSTSYLFTNGPFQNSGVKLDYAFSDRFSIMVGLFNDWNVYVDDNGITDFGAQVYFSPVSGWDLYVNFVTGSPSGTIIDITTGYQVTDKIYIGLNAADYNISATGSETGGYSGVALYPQYSFTDYFALGLRTEYFQYKEAMNETGVVESEQASVIANTLTANFSLGNLTIIPEIRLDNTSEDFFVDSDELPTDRASQFTIAAVYGF